MVVKALSQLLLLPLMTSFRPRVLCRRYVLAQRLNDDNFVSHNRADAKLFHRVGLLTRQIVEDVRSNIATTQSARTLRKIVFLPLSGDATLTLYTSFLTISHN